MSDVAAEGRAVDDSTLEATNRRAESGRDALIVLALVVLVIAVVASLMWASPFVGSSDSASAAEVGRNLARGNGYTTDIVWLFVDKTPLHHAESQWPVSQPTLIALSMLVLGETAFAAKVVNAFWLGLLAASTFLLSRSLKIGAAWSTLAAMLVVSTPLLLLNSLYCMTHAGAVALVMLLVWLTVRETDFDAAGSHSSWMVAALLGAVVGLLILQRPFYVFMMAPTWLVLAIACWRAEERSPNRLGAIAQATTTFLFVALLVVSPLLYRNWSEFGRVTLTPNTDTSAIHNLTGRWDQDLAYRVYWDTGLPAVEMSLRDWARRAYVTAQRTSDGLRLEHVVPLPLLLAGMVGMGMCAFGDHRRRRHAAVFFIASIIAGYTVLVFGHFQPNYVLWIVPFLAIGSVVLITSLVSAVRGGSPNLSATAVAVAVLGVGLVLAPNVVGSWDVARASLAEENTQAAVLAVDCFESDDAEPGTVMSDRPWEVAFHADRAAVKLPKDTPERIRQVADYYDVRYLVLSGAMSLAEREQALAAWDTYELTYSSDDGVGVEVYTLERD